MHLDISPNKIEFDDQKVGTVSAVRTVHVRSQYDAAIPIVPFKVTANPRFTLRDGSEYVTEAFDAQAGTCTDGIPPKGSCELSVTFNPKIEGAAKSRV